MSLIPSVSSSATSALTTPVLNSTSTSQSASAVAQDDSALKKAIDRLSVSEVATEKATQPAIDYKAIAAKIKASEMATLLGSGGTSSSATPTNADGSVDYNAIEGQMQASEMSALLGSTSIGGGSSNGMSSVLSASVSGTTKATMYIALIQAMRSKSALDQYG